MVGFVPENVIPGLHRAAAAVHFLGAGFGMIALGLALRGRFGWMSVFTGIIVAAAVLELGRAGGIVGQEIGIGALERVASYGIAGWMVVLGVWSYRRVPIDIL